MKRKGIYTLTSLFIVGLFIVGALSVMAEYGDSNDPLITKSYIDSILTPQVETMIDQAVADNKSVIESYLSSEITAHKAEIDKKIASINTGNINVSQSVVDSIANDVVAQIKNEGITVGTSWEVVQIPAGKSLVGQVGTEIVPRLGSATVYSTGSVGIVNLTTGGMVNPKAAVTANNLYLVSIADRGVTAGANGATVLVSGSYTIK
ncbi:MAG: hypothetical protein IKU13_08215 [Clostridia bacterium]|nr:hypothetical protein [Clostridia bacterium]MBR5266403.1 hypothetical protein [Clostridia bacterium]